MKKLILIILALSFHYSCAHKDLKENKHIVIQNYKQLIGNQILSESDSVIIPFSKQGYSLHLPESKPIATLIFLSGSALDTTKKIDEYDIINPALAKNMAVLFVSSGKVIEFLFTDEDIAIINRLVEDALEKNELLNKPIFLAGMSLGGTMALRYSEYCFLNKSSSGVKPSAIAICDAPLDMVRMWHEQKQAIKNNFHPKAIGEAHWVLHHLKSHLGGSPNESMRAYVDYSPFTYKNINKSKIDLFKSIPIRMYHEPDIKWWIENRGKDYNTINSIDLAGFYNYLRQAGNKEVELISSNNKRRDFKKASSPHTWTIVDNEELVAWFLEKM